METRTWTWTGLGPETVSVSVTGTSHSFLKRIPHERVAEDKKKKSNVIGARGTEMAGHNLVNGDTKTE